MSRYGRSVARFLKVVSNTGRKIKNQVAQKIYELINAFIWEEENAKELLKICFNKDDAKIELKNKREILNGYIKKQEELALCLTSFRDIGSENMSMPFAPLTSCCERCQVLWL